MANANSTEALGRRGETSAKTMASQLEHLSNIHEIILGMHELLSAIPAVRDDRRAAALTCATHLYLDTLGEVIQEMEEAIGEDAK